MYSLRRVLAVRFSLTIFVALSLIALWALIGVQRTLRRQTDHALTATLAVLNAQLAAGETIPQQPRQSDFAYNLGEGSRVSVLRDIHGLAVAASAPETATFPLDTIAFTAALHGRTAWASEIWNDGRIRSVYAPAPRGSPAGAAVVQVAASLKPLSDATEELLFAMLGTVFLGTLAVALGSFWLAGSAVQPVVEIAGQAARIAPDTPGKRITTHADVAEYASLIEVLNGLLERCERAFNAQRRLVGDVGHELKTPLTAVQGEFEIALRSERTPERYQQALRSGLEEIERMTTMCDELLLITRADSHTLPLQRVATDVNDLARDSVEGVRRRLDDKGITLSTRLEYAGNPVYVDSELIAKVVDELIDNAVKFTPAGSAIAVGTEAANGNARLWVEDSGPGVPTEQFLHLFEPFYRADPARTRDEGTGLGLCMAASVARAHGGTIRATNLPQRGARFELELPFRASPRTA